MSVLQTPQKKNPFKKLMNWKEELCKTKRWLQNARFVVLMKTILENDAV